MNAYFFFFSSEPQHAQRGIVVTLKIKKWFKICVWAQPNLISAAVVLKSRRRSGVRCCFCCCSPQIIQIIFDVYCDYINVFQSITQGKIQA